jgi:hypothetical protein
MQALIRKAGHVLDDPVLRRWLVRRAVGLEKSRPAFIVGQPPYLGSTISDGEIPRSILGDFPAGEFATPDKPVRIELPGQTVELAPENPSALFDQPYDDLETLLAAHRFAWLPVARPSVDTDWVAALWRTWVDRFASEMSGWPWHAYTAAERAINIIDFSRRFGWPGDPSDTATLLAHHADIIRRNLEYFGDDYTSNHLSNNGRGLLRIGSALGMMGCADTGAQIMVAEAGRIFGRSGVLREGSTHYHLLVTRNYIDAWLDARAADLEHTGMLHDIAERAFAVIPQLHLPGGLPLIGDISPDVPPAHLAALTGGGDSNSWPSNLPEDRQRDVRDLIAASAVVSPDKLADDGWHRFGGHQWQALAFVSPDGWPPMPGHGHHDLGSFELHDGERPIIVDPGRGSYSDTDYAGAQLHNYLTIDGAGPTSVNRPYYSNEYRGLVSGVAPSMSRTPTGGTLTNAGFSRLRGVGTALREWRFLEDRLEILDRVEGQGTHRIRRQFHTTAASRQDSRGATLEFDGAGYNLFSDCRPTVIETDSFTSYGCARPGYQITFDQKVSLPFESKTIIVRL